MSLNGNTEEMQRGNLHGKVVSIPLVDKSLTKSGYSADAKATGDALSKKVNIVDIVDNLNSYVNNKPLSAKQGAELKRRIDGIDPHFAENVIYDDTNVKDALDSTKNRFYSFGFSDQNATFQLTRNRSCLLIVSSGGKSYLFIVTNYDDASQHVNKVTDNNSNFTVTISEGVVTINPNGYWYTYFKVVI
jgi:hypothetical protein